MILKKAPSYLKQVGTKYHFRFAFSQKYCKCLSGEIRLSLRTGDLLKARKLATKLAQETRGFIEGEGAYMAATKKEIKAALGAYLRAVLDLNDMERLEGKDPFELKGVTPTSFAQIGKTGLPKANPFAKVPGKDMLRLQSISIKDALLQRETSPETEKGAFSVQDFINSSGLDVQEGSVLYEFARREFLKTQQAVNKIEQERAEGDYNSVTELSILNAYQEQPQGPVVQEKADNRSVSEVVQQYIDENVSDGNWKASTLKEYKAHLALFAEMVGDCPLAEVTHETTRAFFDSIKQLPANKKKVKEYRDKSIVELLGMDIPTEYRISAKTVNNIMTSLSAFYNWGVTREYLSQDYSRKMRVKIQEKDSDLKDPFTDTELKMIFDDLQGYQDDIKQPHRWWIPLIGLYTGARLEEIAQLHTKDVREEDGVWVFDINDEDGKKLKNKNSRRIIPVHQKLIDAGFLQYHVKVTAGGHKRLFPNLNPLKGKCGHYLSRWFGPYLTKMKIKTKAHNVSFHSYRHTFITRAKHLDLPESYIKQIVGHSAGSITFGRYGKGYDLNKLKDIIDQVAFPI